MLTILVAKERFELIKINSTERHLEGRWRNERNDPVNIEARPEGIENALFIA